MNEIQFKEDFTALTGKPPFPWQVALYERFVSDRPDNIPATCNLPTGLGKTSVIAIWLIALTNGARVPRRLVYVVNRRTVVDQTTDEVEKYRKAIEQKPELVALKTYLGIPLALSTLRGQYADNREWSADPSRPAVICGTVDMIGSRLLFSGYGVGFKGKPLHAGFLGQDALLVHDEAHLEPAFQRLIETIQCEQIDREKSQPLPWLKFRVMELTATSRGGGDVFELTTAEKNAKMPLPPRPETEDEMKKAPPIHHVWWRTHAKKSLVPNEIEDEKKDLVPRVVKLALEYRDNVTKPAVLIFVRTVQAVDEVVKGLKAGKIVPENIETLTGTMRGLERDALVKKPTFRRFLKAAVERTSTVYLVCTAAGEVGVDMSADHMICDLTPLDSMAQRLGRVNRYGTGDARIDFVYPKEFDTKDKPYELARERTRDLLQKLPGDSANGFDASPNALRGMMGHLSDEERDTAFTPKPTILPATDILFDAWALTTIKGKLPGRPPVEPYLHGITDYDPPQTTVAWREEVERLTEDVLKHNKLDIEDLLEKYPLKPHEELSGSTNGKNKVFEQLEAIAERDAKREPKERLSAWVVEPDGSGTIYPLQALVERDNAKKPVVALGGRTVILPPKAGGFQSGLLKGDEPFSNETDYDVSDHWYFDKEQTKKRRGRSVDGNPPEPEMREVLRVDFPASEENEDTETQSWYWYVRPLSADDDGSKYSQQPITWQHHTDDVTAEMARIAAALFPDDETFRNALIVSAKLHDLGKKRVVWQRSIGNPQPRDWHAKSGKGWRPMELTSYRHEFGSLVDLENEADFRNLPNHELKELVRHLIAVHHGFGRPHFPDPFDPNATDEVVSEIAAAVPRRFAQLQRKFGRWGLAYLESLLRAADWAASAKPSKEVRV